MGVINDVKSLSKRRGFGLNNELILISIITPIGFLIEQEQPTPPPPQTHQSLFHTHLLISVPSIAWIE